MVKRNPFLSGLCVILGGAFLLAGTAAADVTSDEAAGILIYPKIVLDTSRGIDTTIQLSNTAPYPINVRCFYVNATDHCSDDPTRVCRTNDDCSAGICLDGWQEIDFRMTITTRQPLVWTLGNGMPGGAFPLDGFQRVGIGGQANWESAIPAAPEDPMIGELKCVEVGEDEAPIAANDLKGEATIVKAGGPGDPLDARAYNAVGIQAREGNDGDNTLVIGADGEYNGCPNILIVDHFFDDAIMPNDNIVRSDLTLVSCSEDFEMQRCYPTTVQFLVFNEFEQRFSTSMPVTCFEEIALSDIDTRDRSMTDTNPESTGDLRSIFNINVQGTLAGQTRIRGVDDGAEIYGNGLIGVVEEFYRDELADLSAVEATAAFNIHQIGERAEPDLIKLP